MAPIRIHQYRLSIHSLAFHDPVATGATASRRRQPPHRSIIEENVKRIIRQIGSRIRSSLFLFHHRLPFRSLAYSFTLFRSRFFLPQLSSMYLHAHLSMTRAQHYFSPHFAFSSPMAKVGLVHFARIYRVLGRKTYRRNRGCNKKNCKYAFLLIGFARATLHVGERSSRG